MPVFSKYIYKTIYYDLKKSIFCDYLSIYLLQGVRYHSRHYQENFDESIERI